MVKKVEEKRYYRVISDPHAAPLNDYLEHGYEERAEFALAVHRIVGRWHGRVGECIGTRHAFLLLRFTDTPDGWPEEEWLPRYLLERAAPRRKDTPHPSDDEEHLLDELYEF